MKDGLRCKRGGESGLSLVEVLLGMAILAIGILAVAALQATSARLSRSSADITNASSLATAQMERLMLLPYTHADLNPGTITRASGKYTVRWDVANADLNADGVSDSKSVALTVAWNSFWSPQRQVRLTFLKHDSL